MNIKMPGVQRRTLADKLLKFFHRYSSFFGAIKAKKLNGKETDVCAAKILKMGDRFSV